MTKQPFTIVNQKKFFIDLLEILADHGVMEESKEVLEYLPQQFAEFCDQLEQDIDGKVDTLIQKCRSLDLDPEFTLRDAAYVYLVPAIKKLFKKYGLTEDKPDEGGVAVYTIRETQQFKCPYCSKSINYAGKATEWGCDGCGGKYKLEPKA